MLPVWTPPSCATLLLCYGHREHTPDLLRPLPAYADTVCSTEQVGDPCSHVPRSGDERHEVHAGLPHITHAVITSDATERFPLLDPLEHGRSFRGRDLPARIRSSVRVVRQRHKPRIVKGRGERIILR